MQPTCSWFTFQPPTPPLSSWALNSHIYCEGHRMQVVLGYQQTNIINVSWLAILYESHSFTGVLLHLLNQCCSQSPDGSWALEMRFGGRKTNTFLSLSLCREMDPLIYCSAAGRLFLYPVFVREAGYLKKLVNKLKKERFLGLQPTRIFIIDQSAEFLN